MLTTQLEQSLSHARVFAPLARRAQRCTGPPLPPRTRVPDLPPTDAEPAASGPAAISSTCFF